MEKIIVFYLLIIINVSFCQSSIISSGGTQRSSSYQVTSTLGEVVNASYSSPKYVMKQGVLQVAAVVVTDLAEEVALETNAYPSPFRELITVKLNKEGTVVANLTTMDGNVVLSEVFDTNDFTLNTTTLPIGVYVLELVNEEKGLKRTVKLLKIE